MRKVRADDTDNSLDSGIRCVTGAGTAATTTTAESLQCARQLDRLAVHHGAVLSNDQPDDREDDADDACDDEEHIGRALIFAAEPVGQAQRGDEEEEPRASAAAVQEAEVNRDGRPYAQLCDGEQQSEDTARELVTACGKRAWEHLHSVDVQDERRYFEPRNRHERRHYRPRARHREQQPYHHTTPPHHRRRLAAPIRHLVESCVLSSGNFRTTLCWPCWGDVSALQSR